jgi:hypothetical protein
MVEVSRLPRYPFPGKTGATNFFKNLLHERERLMHSPFLAPVLRFSRMSKLVKNVPLLLVVLAAVPTIGIGDGGRLERSGSRPESPIPIAAGTNRQVWLTLSGTTGLNGDAKRVSDGQDP